MPFAVALRRRWYLAGALVLIVAIVATVLLVRSSSAAPAQQVVAARSGTLDRTVALNGTIAPANRADLAFSAGGQVTRVDVAVGQQVAQGQALAAVDAASLPGQTAQARSSLASARARLAADRSAGASAAQIDADNAAVTAAQAQVDVAVQNESQATLTAPFAGTVAAVNVTVGQRVSAGGGAASAAAGSGSGTGAAAAAALGGSQAASGSGAGASSSAAVVIVSTGAYRVDATVDDTQVGQLAVGQAAAITPNGATAPVQGTVASIGLVAASTSGVASYPVSITVTGSPPGLHLGASAQIEVTTQQVKDAVLVPAAAVHGAGPAAAVTVLEQGKAVNRPVTVGASAGGRTQITKGLQPGEEVVVPEATRPAAGGGGFGGFGGGATSGRGGNRTATPPTPAPAPGGGGGS